MTENKKLLSASTVITAHLNADFDALAAMVAASKLYPHSVLIFPGTQEENLHDFYINSIMYLFNFQNIKDIDIESVQTLVVCDTRQKSRLSHIALLLERKNLDIHVYDHHPNTDDDILASKLNVRPWGSTTAILVKEIKKKKVQINNEEATLFGLGIYEDTGSFLYPSTTEHDLAAAAWLKSQGMAVSVIDDLFCSDLSAQQIILLGELLEQSHSHDIHGVEIVITRISTDKYINDFALLVRKLMDMKKICVLFVLARMDDRIHVLTRSNNAQVDVGYICRMLGGGGHPYAASAVIKEKTLTQVYDDLFALLYSYVNPQAVVTSITTTPAFTVADTDTLDAAFSFMQKHNLKSVPVIKKESTQCIGLLEQSIAKKAVEHKVGHVQVSAYMIHDFQTVTQGTNLYQVIEILLQKSQPLLPVSEAGKLTGVITKTDLLNLLVEEPARIPESLAPEKTNKKRRNFQALMKNRLSEKNLIFLEEAGQLAKQLGYTLFVVGGFVRDLLLNRSNLDFDLVVEGDGVHFAKKMAMQYKAKVKIHQKFRTALILFPDGTRVDVATARLEYYKHPAAIPIVELSSIKMDLYRRDFTINALAICLAPQKFGELVDFFNAQNDIKDKALRVLHSLSFVEDPTRILRAVRFEQRFGFAIGAQTQRLIKNALQLELFARISGSRLFHEMQAIFTEEHPFACLERLQELGILYAIHPLLEITEKRRVLLEEIEKVHVWYTLLYLESDISQWQLYFLGLTLKLTKNECQEILKKFGIINKEAHSFLTLRETVGKNLARLIQLVSQDFKLSELCLLIEKIPVEGILFLMAQSRKDTMRKNISQYLSRLRYLKAEIDGNDLQRIGIPTGPKVGEILHRVRAAVLDGEVESREQQLELARKYSKKFRVSL